MPASRRATEAARAPVVGIVLAAGAGRRFGSAKQLAPLWGRPLLEHGLAAMAASRVDRFVVVLGSNAEQVIAGADLQGGHPVVCERWAEGQSASLRAGVASCPEAAAVLVTLGDQPLIAAAAIDRVLAGRRPDVSAVRATYDGRPGHPVLLERALFDQVEALRRDQGARELLASAAVALVPCDGLGSPLDVDTPESLAALERLDR